MVEPVPPGDSKLPVAFLCSRIATQTRLRHRVWELGRALGGPIWVAEYSEPSLGASPDEIMDVCLENVQRAPVFLCVLDGSYGGSTGLNPAEISLIELEVFQAVLARKPLYIYVVEPFTPEAPLTTFLRALEIVQPGVVRVCRSEDEALGQIELALKRWTRRHLLRPARILGGLVQQLARRRSSAYSSMGRDIRFLDGVFVPHHTPADRELIAELVRQAGLTPNQPKKLVWSWMAIRHLSATPYTETTDMEVLTLWDKALSRWASASAWYGLHGHVYVGRLAAVNTLLDLRERAGMTASRSPAEHIQGTRGAIASEYYSIAKMVPSRRDKEVLLQKALVELGIALEARPSDPSGFLAIRGSVHLALGDRDSAISDYQSVLRLREAADNPDPAGIGEAQSELGYAYLRRGRLKEARRYLEEGVALLDRTQAVGFTIRARKKLATYYFLVGRPFGAVRQLAMAYKLAATGGFRGQISNLMALAWRIHRKK